MLTIKPTPIICCANPTILVCPLSVPGLWLLASGFKNSQASRLRMRTLGLVDRNRHAHGANGPTGHDATHQDHGQLHGSALQDGAYSGQQGAELDGRFSSKTIDCQTGRQGSNSGCSYRTMLAVFLCKTTDYISAYLHRRKCC